MTALFYPIELVTTTANNTSDRVESRPICGSLLVTDLLRVHPQVDDWNRKERSKNKKLATRACHVPLANGLGLNKCYCSARRQQKLECTSIDIGSKLVSLLWLP